MRPRKLYHPLWTHLPAVALLAYVTYRFIAAMPLPATVPLHFDAAGNPNRWGSPWELFAAFAGLGLLYLGISVLADELWARQESRKAFNWLSLLDEAIIAIFAAIIARLWRLPARSESPRLDHYSGLGGGVGGSCVCPGISAARFSLTKTTTGPRTPAAWKSRLAHLSRRASPGSTGKAKTPRG